jgi:hypothetical protein
MEKEACQTFPYIVCQLHSLSSHHFDCLVRDLKYGPWPVKVLTPVQTKQIIINIRKRKLQKRSTNSTKHSKYKYTFNQKNPHSFCQYYCKVCRHGVNWPSISRSNSVTRLSASYDESLGRHNRDRGSSGFMMLSPGLYCADEAIDTWPGLLDTSQILRQVL